MNQDQTVLSTIYVLAEQLGVALELSYSPSEFSTLWPEAIDAMTTAKHLLESCDHQVPEVVVNVITAAVRGLQ
jgi:hypothetical protein